MTKAPSANKARYFAGLARGFNGRVDRLQDLIGSAHWPSVGGSREFLLREFLREFLPARYGVGTGFVLFEHPDATEASLRPSGQLDVLVWDQVEYAPHFRAGEFVVLPPGAVVCVIEVKSTLGPGELKDGLEALMALSIQYDELRVEDGFWDVATPDLMLFGWKPETTKKGLPTPRADAVPRIMRDLVRRRLIDGEEAYTYLFPPVAVFLYGRWTVVLSDDSCSEDGQDIREFSYIGIEMSKGSSGETEDYSFGELLRILSLSCQSEDHQAWYKLQCGVGAEPATRRVVLASGEEVEDLDREAFHDDMEGSED